MNFQMKAMGKLVLRLVFGGVLIYASIDKILSPLDFAQIVENYQVVGPRAARWVAVGLPWLELIVGLLLIFGVWLDGAALLNFGMMSVFLVAVLQAYLRGLDIHCGCFSAEGAEINSGKIAFNLLLFAGSAILLWLELVSQKSFRTVP